MKKFLDKAATFILEHCKEDHLQTVVIFPNKRSEVFLKKHLKEKISHDFWLPECYTTDEFMVKASGLQKTDPILLYFELFKIHQKIAQSDARSIDDFLVWAHIILSDFNDIDLYIADPTAVFTNLSESKAMEAWNPDGRPLTDLQKNYLNFFQSLGTYYSELNSILKEKNSGYTGWVYRQLAENIDLLSKKWPWTRFVVVGLNALSKSEKQVFTYLNKHFKVDFLWDADEYYLFPEKFGLQQMEAGRFIRKLIDEWKIEDPKWIINNLAVDSEKNIQIIGVPKQIGQVKYTGQWLEKIFSANEANRNFSKTENKLDTAIVLADEKLLIPLLNALPKIENEAGEKLTYNVTMGYPLSSGPLKNFILQWLDLHIKKQEDQKQKFPVLQMKALFNNPVLKMIPGSSQTFLELQDILLEKAASYFSSDEINTIISKLPKNDNRELIQQLVKPVETAREFTDILIDFLQIIKAFYLAEDNKQVLLKEEYKATTVLLKKISLIVHENTDAVNLKALHKILIQLFRRNEINLKGEPLSGIQIMGMLETRNLDFENIILLSANEGILPKADAVDSFIPFDIRSQFALPLPKEKTDVFAYHFYRLIQRAKNITLLYNSEADELGGGEKSRYLLQLTDELAAVNSKMKKPVEQLLHIDLDEKKQEPNIIIPKTNEVLKLITARAKRGFSPSALNTYITCSLQYYFAKILGLSPAEEPDGSIEANTFGTIIHDVLEKIYKPFIGKVIEPSELKERLLEVNQILHQSFHDQLNGADFKSGKNLLTFEVAKSYIKQFVEKEIASLKREPHRLIALEEEVKSTISMNKAEIQLRGTIDRIDSNIKDGEIILADYKTGKVESRELKFDSWESLPTDPKLSKVFQLLFYTYLFLKNNDQHPRIKAGIFSLRAISSGFITATLPEGSTNNELLSEFEKVLTKLIGEIFEPTIPFKQTTEEDNCNYCDFKVLCNRSGGSSF